MAKTVEPAPLFRLKVGDRFGRLLNTGKMNFAIGAACQGGPFAFLIGIWRVVRNFSVPITVPVGYTCA
jgi:hypothetical protein